MKGRDPTYEQPGSGVKQFWIPLYQPPFTYRDWLAFCLRTAVLDAARGRAKQRTFGIGHSVARWA